MQRTSPAKVAAAAVTGVKRAERPITPMPKLGPSPISAMLNDAVKQAHYMFFNDVHSSAQEAVDLLIPYSRIGRMEAIFTLAYFYKHATGDLLDDVNSELAVCVAYLERAERLGHPRACEMLGMIYEYGDGWVTNHKEERVLMYAKDLGKAIRYYEKAKSIYTDAKEIEQADRVQHMINRVSSKKV